MSADIVNETYNRLPALLAHEKTTGTDHPSEWHNEYGFFAEVVVPYLKYLLRNSAAHTQELARAFQFVEWLAQHHNFHVKNLVQLPILEELTCDPESLIVTAAGYIAPGSCTEAAYYDMGRFLRLAPQSLAYWRGDTDQPREDQP